MHAWVIGAVVLADDILVYLIQYLATVTLSLFSWSGGRSAMVVLLTTYVCERTAAKRTRANRRGYVRCPSSLQIKPASLLAGVGVGHPAAGKASRPRVCP